jgi:hypothetical protein
VFADEIGVATVTGGFLDHVEDCPSNADGVAEPSLAGGVEVLFGVRLVGRDTRAWL